MIDVNLKGTIYAVRAALPHMLGRQGDVITLASEAGRRGLPHEAVYCASKFGQVGFTRALDHELREHGIRCTNVCPGGVATDFALDDGRGRSPEVLPGMMTAEDVAEVVVFTLERPRHFRMLELGVPADDGVVMGLEPVRWGIVSTAHINRLVIPGAHESPKVDLARGREPRPHPRAGVRARSGRSRRRYGSYEELLADPEIEAVYISLPNTLHCEWSIRALDAGKHVLCEKPLSRHPADVEAAFDAAERNGRFLMEAFMYRHNPQTAKLVELVRERRDRRAAARARGVQLLALRRREHPPAARGRGRRADGRRLLLRQRLAPAGRRAGERLRRRAHRRDAGRDWVFTGLMRFPGDVLAQFDCGTALPERDELEAIGSEGSLFLDDPWHCRKPGIELRRGGEVERIEIEPVDSYRLELENLSDAIRGEGEPLLGREDALAQARVIEALFRSADVGRAARVEL